MQTYAIGDIHGHLDKLIAAHDLIAADRAAHGDTETPVIHVGDLVDRGPDSRGVIAYLMAGIEAGQPWLTVKGNHDRMLAGFWADVDYVDPGLRSRMDWFDPRLGGAATLGSYGVADAAKRDRDAVHAETRQAVPAAHVQFLNAMPGYVLRGEVLYVHAGVRPGVDLRDQVEDDLVWIRSGFLEDTRDHGALVVHGHTALDEVTHHGNRLNIDSGAAYGRALSAVVIEDGKSYLLTPKGRVALG